MLNTLSRHLARATKPTRLGGLSRLFSNGLRFKPRESNSPDMVSSLDFLSTDNVQAFAEEETELELDVEHLRESMQEADSELLSASSGKTYERYTLMASEDIRQVIKNQTMLLTFTFNDIQRLVDLQLDANLQKLIDSAEVSLPVKLRLVSNLEKYQTVANVQRLLSEAFEQNFEDQGKELLILVGATANQSKEIRGQLVDHLRSLCQHRDLESLNRTLVTLVSSVDNALLVTNQVDLPRPKRSKKQTAAKPEATKVKTNKLWGIMDDRMAKAALSQPEKMTTQLLLDIIKFRMAQNKSSAQAELEEIVATYPDLDLFPLLEYDSNILGDLNLEQKVALYWIYSKCLNSRKFKSQHKKRLVRLLDTLLIYDTAYSNYLVRRMMEKCRIMDEDVSQKVTRVTHNDMIIDSSEIVLSPDFAAGCTIFGRRYFGSIRGDKLRIMAKMPEIFASMPDALHKAVFFLNASSFMLYSEKFKRIAFYNIVTSTLDMLEPSNPQHIEPLCYLLIGTLERKRNIQFTTYVHHQEIERHLRSVVEAFLNKQADLIQKMTCSAKPTKKHDALRSQVVTLCLLAKIKFEIKTPVMENIAKFFPDMNDFAFAACFSAVDNDQQLDALIEELKVRLKPGSGFLVHFLNIILGSFKFRSKLCTYVLNPESFIDQQFEGDLTIDQLIKLPIAKNPNLFKFNESCKKQMPIIATIVEKYMKSLFAKKNIHLVHTHYGDLVVAQDIFSPNEYREQKSPFCMQSVEKFFLSQEELLMFYRLCDYLNYSTVQHWHLFEKVILCLLGEESDLGIPPMANKKIGWGMLRSLVTIMSHQQLTNQMLWQALEKATLENLNKVIFADHVDMISKVVRGFAIANQGSNEFWAVVEALTHAVWEFEIPLDVRCSLISTLLKRSKVISVVWLNTAIGKLLKSNPSEASLRYLLYYANPMVVQAANFAQLVTEVQKSQTSLALTPDQQKQVHNNDRLKIALERRTFEFRQHMRRSLSADQRDRYEDDMSLFID